MTKEQTEQLAKAQQAENLQVAYEKGFDSHPFDSNPYPYDSLEYKEWENGHYDMKWEYAD
jgi:hypothetical protein